MNKSGFFLTFPMISQATRRHVKFMACVLIVMMPCTARAAINDEEAANLNKTMFRIWHGLPRSCVLPSIPETFPNQQELGELDEQIATFNTCVALQFDTVTNRTSAQRMMNPEVWSQLSDQQRATLDDVLIKANIEVMENFQSAKDKLQRDRKELESMRGKKHQ